MPAWWVLVPVAAYLIAAVLDDVRPEPGDASSSAPVALLVLGPVALLACLATLRPRPRLAAVAGVVAAVTSLVTWQLPLGYLCSVAVLFTAAAVVDLPLLLGAGLATAAWAGAAGVLAPAVVPSLVWLVAPTLVGAGVLGLVVGSALRRRRAAEAAVATLEDLAAQARERERRLLARELHDVVAHELTVIALQASVMRVADDPARVEAAREAVERTSRAALDELQRLLSVLRDDAVSTPAGPVPLGRVVDALAEQLRSLGHAVTTSCDVPELPRSVELAADRVLREAVTNIVKHAGGAVTCRIDVRVAEGGLRVDVENTLAAGGPQAVLASGRSGVTGLAERLRGVGGDIDARERDGRWVVRARLPFVELAG